MAKINSAIRMGDAEKTVAEMMNPEAQLPEVYAFAAALYQRELSTLQQQSHEVSNVLSYFWKLICIARSTLSVSLNVPVLSIHRTVLILHLF